MRIGSAQYVIFVFVSFAFSGIGDTQCLDKLVYGSAPLCKRPIRKELIWFLNGNRIDLSQGLFMDKSKNLFEINTCSKVRQEPSRIDTLYGNFRGYIDIYYRDCYADSAYMNMVRQIGVNEGSLSSGYYWFAKGGRIICLDRDQSLLRIISINACANASVFEKIVTCLKQEQTYNKVLVVDCGEGYTEF